MKPHVSVIIVELSKVSDESCWTKRYGYSRSYAPTPFNKICEFIIPGN